MQVVQLLDELTGETFDQYMPVGDLCHRCIAGMQEGINYMDEHECRKQLADNPVFRAVWLACSENQECRENLPFRRHDITEGEESADMLTAVFSGHTDKSFRAAHQGWSPKSAGYEMSSQEACPVTGETIEIYYIPQGECTPGPYELRVSRARKVGLSQNRLVSSNQIYANQHLDTYNFFKSQLAPTSRPADVLLKALGGADP